MPTQEPRHTPVPPTEDLPEPRAPQWVSYAPPAPTRWDRFMRMLRRYGFAGTSLILVLCVTALLLRPRPAPEGPSSSRLLPPVSADAPVEGTIVGTAMLSITSGPAGATVFLNRQPVGVTPLKRHATPAGVYLLSVQKPGYTPLDSVVVLREDAHLKLTVTLPEAEYPSGARTAQSDGERIRVQFRDQQEPRKIPHRPAHGVSSHPPGWHESEEARKKRIAGYVQELLARQQSSAPSDTLATSKSAPPQDEQQNEQDSTTLIHW